MNRLDAIRERVAFTQTLPNVTKITAVSINLEDLVLLLETAETADALMDARNVAPVIPLGYWGELGRCLRELGAEQAS